MPDDPALRIFPDEFVPNVQASDTYKRWAKSSPKDKARWEAFRDALLAGAQSPSIPAMSTTFGKALVAAGKEHMSISQLVGVVVPPLPPPPGGGFDLPQVAWEGGPAYWGQFSKASAAGWTSPAFFPIAVYYSHANAAAALGALGINTYMAVDPGGGGGGPLTDISAAGLYALVNSNDWTPAQANAMGNNAVGWFVNDEPEMIDGASNNPPTVPNQYTILADHQADIAAVRAFGDGRFIFSNYGNGVLGTYWSPDTMDDFVQAVDACSVDQYAYTRPLIRTNYDTSPYWSGTAAQAESSAAYGWQMDRMRQYDNPASRRPLWFFVETKMPFLNDSGSEVILYDQIEGAVWSGIAHEARGIAYFQQNGFYPGGLPVNDPNTGLPHCTGMFSLITCEQGLKDRVTQINARVTALAPVLNTQSWDWSFGASGIDTMLKTYQSYAYIFASVGIGGALGSKTFSLPPGVSGASAEVLYESRTVNVSGAQFSDSFASEFSHHIYKIAL